MIRSIVEKWYGVICTLTWILCASMCLLLGFQILNRFIFKISAAWSEEFCRYNFVWLTLVASAKAQHDRQQLAVDIMPYLLEKKPLLNNSLKILAQLLALAFLGVMFVQSVFFCIRSIGITCLTVRIPVIYVYIILPIGLLSMFIFELVNMIDTFGNFRQKEQEVI